MRYLALALLLAACTPADDRAWSTPPAPHAVPFGVSNVDGLVWFDEALDLWNDAVACTLFVPVDAGADVDVVTAPADGSVGSEHAGGAYLRPDGTYEIRVFPDGLGEATTTWAVVSHELGHVLGLEHDADPFSVMHSPASTRRR